MFVEMLFCAATLAAGEKASEKPSAPAPAAVSTAAPKSSAAPAVLKKPVQAPKPIPLPKSAVVFSDAIQWRAAAAHAAETAKAAESERAVVVPQKYRDISVAQASRDGRAIVGHSQVEFPVTVEVADAQSDRICSD